MSEEYSKQPENNSNERYQSLARKLLGYLEKQIQEGGEGIKEKDLVSFWNDEMNSFQLGSVQEVRDDGYVVQPISLEGISVDEERIFVKVGKVFPLDDYMEGLEKIRKEEL